MTSGEISRNRAVNAGGVFVRGGGKFTMTGGGVSDNKSDTLGGGVYNSGTFEMSGTAKITGNKADGSGGGVFVLGGSKFTMDGGEISSNNTKTYGGGVFVYPNGEFIMTGGTISNNTATINGGGVYINSGTFTMNGGTTKIKENTANGDGGGVYVASSTFTMEDGTIEKNEANYGGGVYVSGGTFTMKGSASAITGNTARGRVQSGDLDGGGGGVYLNGATFTMSGGTISGNETAGSLANSGGGGVYTFGVSAFTMTGGTVSGNTAQNAQGNGAFISPSGKLNMKGASKFQGDNDVYLFVYTGVTEADIPTICVTGMLSAATPVATITPSDYVAGRQVLSKGGSVTEITQTICDKFKMKDTGRIKPDGSTKGVLYWEIGDEGPGSGLVCYYDVAGFIVNGKNCHYLECSKDSLGSMAWSPTNNTMYTPDGIGNGYSNTQTILIAYPSATTAAKACAVYSTSTTTAGEWFLPSRQEAYKIYNIEGITGDLWTSISIDSSQAYCVGNASFSKYSDKKSSINVRAVRAF